MGTALQKVILAVITTRAEKIAGGSPIFIADTEEDLQQTAFTLEKILDGIAHEVNADTFIIVKH